MAIRSAVKRRMLWWQRESASPKSLTPSTVSQIMAVTIWAVEHNGVDLITHACAATRKCNNWSQRTASTFVRRSWSATSFFSVAHCVDTSPEFGLRSPSGGETAPRRILPSTLPFWTSKKSVSLSYGLGDLSQSQHKSCFDTLETCPRCRRQTCRGSPTKPPCLWVTWAQQPAEALWVPAYDPQAGPQGKRTLCWPVPPLSDFPHDIREVRPGRRGLASSSGALW